MMKPEEFAKFMKIIQTYVEDHESDVTTHAYECGYAMGKLHAQYKLKFTDAQFIRFAEGLNDGGDQGSCVVLQ